MNDPLRKWITYIIVWKRRQCKEKLRVVFRFEGKFPKLRISHYKSPRNIDLNGVVMNTTIETQLGNYVLVEELSQDDVVTVYRGTRKADQAAVIIKVVSSLFASDEFLVRRFKLATHQTAKLEHPNIIRTYEAEQEGNKLYLVQDFVEARSLAQVLTEEGSFSPQRMQMIARQIASALDYTHQKSVTHGNLSASQIFLGPDDHVWVAGFGQTQALFGVNLMKQGYVVSSPETMAPERVHGQGPSRQSDLYALGILCYQMLAGRPPFTGTSSAILHAQAYQQPRPLYRLNPGIPVALSEVIGRMLSKGLELRYNTGAEFARALAVACSLPKGFPTHGFQQSAKRPGLFLTKWWGYGSVPALVILTLVTTLVWAGYQLGVSQQTLAIKVAPAISSSLETGGIGSTALITPPPNDFIDSLLPTATPRVERLSPEPQDEAPVVSSLSDTLLLTPTSDQMSTPRLDTLLATSTSIPTPTRPAALPVARLAAAIPAAEPAIPTGKGLLIFNNPTGHDLVVDLTGPTGESKLIPPNSLQEFVLTPGRYQCVIHTPTGQWLASRVLEFDIFEGQAIEKDYYTDYDPQSAQVAND
jgi:serine/threonine protein kinase